MNISISRFLWMALWTGLVLAIILLQPMLAHGEDSPSKNRVPRGVYIDLNREFYEALKNEDASGSRVYSNDPSAEYLKQISISARFMVETNLQILRQQERIIQMLQDVLDRRGK